MNKSKLKHMLKEEAIKLYEAKEAEFPEAEQMRELERVVLLQASLTASGWIISTIWISCARASACRPTAREILWWNIRWPAMICLTP